MGTQPVDGPVAALGVHRDRCGEAGRNGGPLGSDTSTVVTQTVGRGPEADVGVSPIGWSDAKAVASTSNTVRASCVSQPLSDTTTSRPAG